ncbi:MAG: DUF2339 domain-containing protein [Candidatus Paceibacterota bacterium]
MSIVIFIVLIFWIVSLSNRIKVLENRVGVSPKPNLLDGTNTPSTQAQAQIHETMTEGNSYPQAVSASAPPPPQQLEPGGFEKFGAWLAKDWLAKLGVLCVVLALGWFLSIAFDNNWIGPQGRIALGFLVGALCLFGGIWRLPKVFSQGAILLVLGLIMVVFTTYSARAFYEMFPALVALLIIFSASGIVAFIGTRYNKQSLALVSVFSGLIAPIFTEGGGDMFGLMLYLLVVVAGGVLVVMIKRWTAVTLLSLVAMLLYTPILSVGMQYEAFGLILSYVFASLFLVSATYSIVQGSKSEVGLGTSVIVINSIFVLMWTLSTASPEWWSLLFVAWAFVYMGTGYAIFQTTKAVGRLVSPFALAIMFIGTATALEFKGSALTIAFLLESLACIAGAYALTQNRKAVSLATATFIVPVVLTFIHLLVWWQGGKLLTEDSFITGIVTLIAFALGIYAHSRFGSDARTVRNFPLAVGIFFGTASLWVALHATLPGTVAVGVALTLFTILGITLYIIGNREGRKTIKLLGIMYISITLLRLLLVDLVTMSTTGRVVTFSVIGVLLISTAFLRKNKLHDTTIQQ